MGGSKSKPKKEPEPPPAPTTAVVPEVKSTPKVVNEIKDNVSAFDSKSVISGGEIQPISTEADKAPGAASKPATASVSKEDLDQPPVVKEQAKQKETATLDEAPPSSSAAAQEITSAADQKLESMSSRAPDIIEEHPVKEAAAPSAPALSPPAQHPPARPDSSSHVLPPKPDSTLLVLPSLPSHTDSSLLVLPSLPDLTPVLKLDPTKEAVSKPQAHVDLESSLDIDVVDRELVSLQQAAPPLHGSQATKKATSKPPHKTLTPKPALNLDPVHPPSRAQPPVYSVPVEPTPVVKKRDIPDFDLEAFRKANEIGNMSVGSILDTDIHKYGHKKTPPMSYGVNLDGTDEALMEAIEHSMFDDEFTLG